MYRQHCPWTTLQSQCSRERMCFWVLCRLWLRAYLPSLPRVNVCSLFTPLPLLLSFLLLSHFSPLPFLSIPLHSSPFLSIPLHSSPFLSIPLHSSPFLSIPLPFPFLSLFISSPFSSPFLPLFH